MSRRLRIALIALTALAVVVAGTIAAVVWLRPGARAADGPGVEVTARDGGRLELPDGTTVTVPPGAVARDTVLTAAVVADPTPPGADTDDADHHLDLGTVYDITLVDGQQLLRPATITYPAPSREPDPEVTEAADQLDDLDLPATRTEDGEASTVAADLVAAATAPVALTYDEATKTWLPEQFVFDQATETVTVTTQHFSWHGFGFLSFPDIKGFVEREVVGVFNDFIPWGPIEACPEADVARRALDVESSSGRHVNWCVGVTRGVDGQTFIRVRNARSYPVKVRYTNATPTDWGSVEPSITALAGAIEEWAGTDRNRSILMPGQYVDLVTTGDPRTDIAVEWDGAYAMLAVLDIVADAALLARGKSRADKKLKEEHLIKLAELIKSGACAVERATDAARSESIGEFVGAFTNVVTTCLRSLLVEVTTNALATLWAGIVAVTAGAVGVVVGYVQAVPALIRGSNNYRISVSATGGSSTGEAGSAPEGGTWLYDLPGTTADDDSGTRTGVELTSVAGTTTAYPSSTTQWVGCGWTSTTTYQLGGMYDTLVGGLGLQPFTPKGLRVAVTVDVDGAVVLDTTLDTPGQVVDLGDGDTTVLAAAGSAAPQQLRVTATTADGTGHLCDDRAIGYVVLADAYLVPGTELVPTPVPLGDITGTWSAPSQGDQDWYDVQLDITGSAGAWEVDISYPRYRPSGTDEGTLCSGYLEPTGALVEGKVLLFTEHITDEIAASCTDLGAVRLWRTGADTLHWEWDTTGGSIGGANHIYADLRRQ